MTLFVYILRFRAVVTGSNPTSFIVRISHWGLVYYEKFTMDPGSYARSKRIIKKILLGPIFVDNFCYISNKNSLDKSM